jgi:hypothetical protein
MVKIDREKVKAMIVEGWDPKDYAATKRDVLRLQMKCNKAVKLLYECAKLFEKIHNGAPISHTVLYNNKNKFKDLARDADTTFDGWFGFLKADGDYIK